MNNTVAETFVPRNESDLDSILSKTALGEYLESSCLIEFSIDNDFLCKSTFQASNFKFGGEIFFLSDSTL